MRCLWVPKDFGGWQDALLVNLQARGGPHAVPCCTAGRPQVLYWGRLRERQMPLQEAVRYSDTISGGGHLDGREAASPCGNALRRILTLSLASPFSFSRAFLWLFFPAFFQVQEVPQARAQPANDRAGPPAF